MAEKKEKTLKKQPVSKAPLKIRREVPDFPVRWNGLLIGGLLFER